MTHHQLDSSLATCHWGYFDARLKPVLEIESGDSVTIRTLTGGPDTLPRGNKTIPPEIHEVHAKAERMVPGHILTGPIAVKGAKPGQVLEVRIRAVKPRTDFGFTFIKPLGGTLPEEFDAYTFRHIHLDRDRNIAVLPWGMELPLAPFFGVMGTAPPAHWGRQTSLVPRAFGGNIDNKELVAGATLYLPVFVEGALFSCGDGHGAQGDGEVCVTAIETALEGTFEFVLREDLSFVTPRAETPTHHLTMGIDPDLDICAKDALREMIGLITERTKLSREEAYMLCSLAADLRVTQTVNGIKGIHCMLLKSLVA
ncbi:acetamidase/formamidase family protein [Bosea sp. (in: a-proteobacteria)]|uniref:acetamidase/formamidase family protein n=1 Tax=Bosea sp. (in: a-proteobacteria) TaxID=1871050 RepID=UPI002FCC1FA9